MCWWCLPKRRRNKLNHTLLPRDGKSHESPTTERESQPEPVNHIELEQTGNLQRNPSEPVFVSTDNNQDTASSLQSIVKFSERTVHSRGKSVQQDMSLADFQRQLHALSLQQDPDSKSFPEEELTPEIQKQNKKYLSLTREPNNSQKFANKYATEGFRKKKHATSPDSLTGHATGSKKVGVFFNQMIELQPLYKDTAVPLILVGVLQNFYDSKAYLAEGIFRIGGNLRVIEQLKQQADLAGVDLLETGLVQGHEDPHDVSSLLKKWLKELPEPLIPTHTFTNLISAQKTESEALRTSQFASLIAMMPPVNRACLKHILYFAKLIVEHSEVNKMKLTNVANVLAPTIMRTANERDFLVNFGVAGGCLVFMLTQFSEIFGHYQLLDFMPVHLGEGEGDENS